MSGCLGERASIPAENVVLRLVLCFLRTRVLAMAVRLPNLHCRVVHRFAIRIDNSALDARTLARHALGSEIFDHHPLQADPQVRADGLRSRGAQAHRGLSMGVASLPRSRMSKR